MRWLTALSEIFRRAAISLLVRLSATSASTSRCFTVSLGKLLAGGTLPGIGPRASSIRLPHLVQVRNRLPCCQCRANQGSCQSAALGECEGPNPSNRPPP